MVGSLLLPVSDMYASQNRIAVSCIYLESFPDQSNKNYKISELYMSRGLTQCVNKICYVFTAFHNSLYKGIGLLVYFDKMAFLNYRYSYKHCSLLSALCEVKID